MDSIENTKTEYREAACKVNNDIQEYERLLYEKKIYFLYCHRKKYVTDLNNKLQHCEKIKKDFLNYHIAFKEKYGDTIREKDSRNVTNSDILEIQGLYSFVEGSRMYLNIYRDYENQLRYKIQQIDTQKSMSWAYISVFVTCIFSIVSIILGVKSYYDSKDANYKINTIQTSTDTLRHHIDSISNKLDSIKIYKMPMEKSNIKVDRQK